MSEQPLKTTLCEFYCEYFSHVINQYLSQVYHVPDILNDEPFHQKHHYNGHQWKWTIHSQRSDVFWEDLLVYDNLLKTTVLHGKDICYNYDKTKQIHIKYWKNNRPVHRHKFYRFSDNFTENTRIILNYKRCIGKIYRGTKLVKKGPIKSEVRFRTVFPLFSKLSEVIDEN